MGGIYDLKKAFKAEAPNVDLRNVTMTYRKDEEGRDIEVYQFHTVEAGEPKVTEVEVGPQTRAEDATERAARIARGAAERIVCRQEPLPGPQSATLAEQVGLSVPQPLFDDNFEADKVFDADKVTYPAAEGGPEDATPFLSRVMGGSKTTEEET